MQQRLARQQVPPLKPALIAGYSLASASLVFGLWFLGEPRADPYRYPYQTTTAEETQRKLEGDIAFYQTRVNANPGDGLELAALAGTYLKKARTSGWATWYVLAEQAARRSLVNLPVFNTAASLVLADIAAAQHRFDEAVGLANEVLAYQPGHEGASALVITSYLAQGKLARAREVAEALARHVPSSGSVSLLALVETAQGQDAAAETHFQAAIGLEDVGDVYSSAWLRTQFGKLKMRHGHDAEAEALYREALRIVPGLPPALLSYADLNTKRGYYRLAEKQYRQVLAHTENSATIFDHAALQGLAQSLLLQNKDASASWREAETILRKDVLADAYGHRRELARLLLDRGRADDAAEALTLLKAELKNRQDVQTLELYTRALERAGRFAEAEATIQQALATGFQEAGLLYLVGSVQDGLNRPDLAQSFYRRARTLDPHFDPETWRRLARGD